MIFWLPGLAFSPQAHRALLPCTPPRIPHLGFPKLALLTRVDFGLMLSLGAASVSFLNPSLPARCPCLASAQRAKVGWAKLAGNGDGCVRMAYDRRAFQAQLRRGLNETWRKLNGTFSQRCNSLLRLYRKQVWQEKKEGAKE